MYVSLSTSLSPSLWHPYVYLYSGKISDLKLIIFSQYKKESQQQFAKLSNSLKSCFSPRLQLVRHDHFPGWAGTMTPLQFGNLSGPSAFVDFVPARRRLCRNVCYCPLCIRANELDFFFVLARLPTPSSTAPFRCSARRQCLHSARFIGISINGQKREMNSLTHTDRRRDRDREKEREIASEWTRTSTRCLRYFLLFSLCCCHGRMPF